MPGERRPPSAGVRSFPRHPASPLVRLGPQPPPSRGNALPSQLAPIGPPPSPSRANGGEPMLPSPPPLPSLPFPSLPFPSKNDPPVVALRKTARAKVLTRMSPSRTGPLTLRTMERPPMPPESSMNSTRTWVTFPVFPVRPRTRFTLASLTGWSCRSENGRSAKGGGEVLEGGAGRTRKGRVARNRRREIVLYPGVLWLRTR